MAAWAVSAIRRSYPKAHVVWAAQDTNLDVIDTAHLVDQKVTVDRLIWRNQRWSPAIWRQQLLRFTDLRKQRFDLAVDFQGHAKTALCLKLSGAKKRISHASTDWLSKSLNRQIKTRRGFVHEVEAHHDLLSSELDLDASRGVIMPAYASIIEPGAVVIQTGASRMEKQYPKDLWQSVALKLVQRGYRVVTVGGQHDACIDLPGVTNLVGQVTLQETLGILRTCHAHIAADTGTGHVAAAYGVRVISLFGVTESHRYRPYGETTLVLEGEGSVSAIHPDQVVDTLLRSEHFACVS